MSNYSSNSSVISEDLSNVHLGTSVFLSLLAALGTVGNTLVVITVLRMSQMHRITYLLVGNMSIVGLLTCLVAIPLHVAHMVVSPTMWEGRSESLCKAQAHVNFGLILSTLANSTAIAACRYQAVNVMYNVRSNITSKTTIKLIFFIWALPVLVAFSASPFVGFSELISDCLFRDLNKAFWYMNVALATPALASTLSMLIFYSFIIRKVRDSHRKIANFHRRSRQTDKSKQSGKRESASESRNEVSSVSQSQVQEESNPNNMGGITVFTTMTSNEAANTPSTSYALDTQPKPASKLAEPKALQQSRTSLQPPKSSHMSRQISSNGEESVDMFSTPSGNSSSIVGNPSSCNSSSLPGRSDGGTKRKVRVRIGGKKRRWLKKEVSLILHLFMNFFFFGFLYLPLCLAHLAHAYNPLGKEAWLMLYTLSLSFASNTWIMYAMLNLKFRRAFKALLHGRRSF